MAAQGDSGVPLSDHLHGLHAHILQRPTLHGQPSHRILFIGAGGVFYL